MGLAVPVCRNGVVSHLGSSVECVVIDRIGIGRVLAFVTGSPDVTDERSALEGRRRNYRIRHNPGALNVPLRAVIWNRPVRIGGQS